MKERIKLLRLHTMFMILFVAGGSIFTFGQSPAVWSTSKDVQKIANKEMFTDVALKNSHIQARTSDYPSWSTSKGVHLVGKNTTLQSKGNVLSKGYPEWTISKGVHRIGRNK